MLRSDTDAAAARRLSWQLDDIGMLSDDEASPPKHNQQTPFFKQVGRGLQDEQYFVSASGTSESYF